MASVQGQHDHDETDTGDKTEMRYRSSHGKFWVWTLDRASLGHCQRSRFAEALRITCLSS